MCRVVSDVTNTAEKQERTKILKAILTRTTIGNIKFMLNAGHYLKRKEGPMAYMISRNVHPILNIINKRNQYPFLLCNPLLSTDV